MLFMYAVGSDVFFAAMRNLYPVQVAAGGAIMIIFGAGILAHKKIFSNVPARNSLFVIWGIAMGLGCSLEATPFLFPLWLSSGPILHKFLSYALFSLIAVFFPLLILIPLVRAGRNSKGYWRTIRTVLGESSGLFLILLGLLMFGGAGR